jgi:DNA-binding transcriptional MerR regulator
MTKKTYYIHEVAEQTGRHENTIRRYIERGFIPEPKREWNGWRVFTQEHIDKIKELTGQHDSQ